MTKNCSLKSIQTAVVLLLTSRIFGNRFHIEIVGTLFPCTSTSGHITVSPFDNLMVAVKEYRITTIRTSPAEFIPIYLYIITCIC